MATTLISVEEYLRSSYEPDCDYVDGEVKERNLGELEHATIQSALVGLFLQNRMIWGIRALAEWRVQVKATRFRVPDLTVIRRDFQPEPILRVPPLLIVEVLSPEDSLPRLKQRITDYLEFGTEHIWVIDPTTRSAYNADAHGFHEPADGSATGTLTIPGTPIHCQLAELWAELDF
jgi:Uma2 family endonuclease